MALHEAPHPAHQRRVPRVGWVGKAFSVLESDFDDALLLDADNVPLSDPEVGVLCGLCVCVS